MPKKKPLPDIKLLHAVLRYEPETGRFYWRERPRELCSTDAEWKRWNKRYAGTEALTASNKLGYLYGRVFTGIYKAHRIAWALYHNEDPVGEMDHINRDLKDNRISNLRLVSASENCRNRGIRSDNKTGHPGISQLKSGQYTVQITVNKEKTHVGTFAKLDDAIAARKAAEVEYNFHPNHGRK